MTLARNGPVTEMMTLKEARERMGYTQQRLADAAGLSIATIRDLEQHIRTQVRDRTWSTLTRLLVVQGFSDIKRRAESGPDGADGVGDAD